jgi:hypothetical protein
MNDEGGHDRTRISLFFRDCVAVVRMWEMMTMCVTWQIRRRGLFEYKKSVQRRVSLQLDLQHVPSIEDTILSPPLLSLLCLLPLLHTHPPLSTFRFRRGQKVGIWHGYRHWYVLSLSFLFFL